MRLAALTKSPRCALKAGTHQHGREVNITDSTDAALEPGVQTTLTVKEEVEVLVAVEVQARVLTTGAIAPRGESSLAKKQQQQNNKQTTGWIASHCHMLQDQRLRRRLTLSRLTMDALMYLTAMSWTTASLDRVSCLNKLPQVLRVNDFRTCSGRKKKKNQLTCTRSHQENIHPSVASPDWRE